MISKNGEEEDSKPPPRPLPEEKGKVRKGVQDSFGQECPEALQKGIPKERKALKTVKLPSFDASTVNAEIPDVQTKVFLFLRDSW